MQPDMALPITEPFDYQYAGYTPSYSPIYSPIPQASPMPLPMSLFATPVAQQLGIPVAAITSQMPIGQINNGLNVPRQTAGMIGTYSGFRGFGAGVSRVGPNASVTPFARMRPDLRAGNLFDYLLRKRRRR